LTLRNYYVTFRPQFGADKMLGTGADAPPCSPSYAGGCNQGWGIGGKMSVSDHFKISDSLT